MASKGKKKKGISDATRIAFKALRGKGLIPKEWRISELTDYKARKVRAIAKEFKTVIKNPQNFSSRIVNEKTANALASSGYKSIKVDGKYRVVLPTKGIEKQTIKNGKLTIYRMRRKEEVYFTGGLDTLAQLSQELDRKPLKENEYWTLKVGDKMTFMQAPFKSVMSTYEYYAYALTDSGRPVEVNQNIQLVKVTLPPDDPIYKNVPKNDLAPY